MRRSQLRTHDSAGHSRIAAAVAGALLLAPGG